MQQKRAWKDMPQYKYDKNNTRHFTLKLNYNYDKEIIEKFEELIESKEMASYIKKLVLEDLHKNK